MRRLLLISRREYLAYVRTVGFWLSLIALPLVAVGSAFFMATMANSSEAREMAVLDLSGAGIQADFIARLNSPGRVEVVATPPDLAGQTEVAAADAVARDLVAEEGGTLDGVVILTPADQGLAARYWSSRTTDETGQAAVTEALSGLNRTRALVALGVDPAAVDQIDATPPQVTVLSPASASGGEVSLQDRLPGLIGFIVAMMLWSLILTGASILLNSVMEEKANRVLEVLLSSASATELLAGKILGVALVTLTVLLVWGGFGGMALAYAARQGGDFAPALSGALAGLGRDGLWFWLMAYFVGGYLMYASVFAAIGSFCETPREAQTLIGPIMMVLVIPVFVLQMAMRDPDLAIVRSLSWVPFFTPFLMSARAPSGPPLYELAGTLAVMGAFIVLVVWLAAKAFRAGALSTTKLDWKGIVSLVRGGGA
ncbi:MAG TPA: ABC transporter permease [Brevundimonas sp.]|jgi:ABC-2 type transport system permease protein|uniref:ABC transporter permease n=1 Tax=Brevundimonas sp. TaxID=1871086 RepID=UPI002CBCF8B0|nr:ABC transporter permease [Brevundimonas sp.]HRH19613.1 ABC transporter permease [Brevundimonas sp.]